jgi:hypothetical protein
MQTWRYHPNKKAKIFDTDVDDMDALAKQGWCESPADFKAEAEQQETALEGHDEERDQLMARFNEDFEQLDKDELVKLGRYLGVKMMKAWKPDTLIEKVRSGLE